MYANMRIELQRHVRIYDTHGKDYAQEGDRPEARKSEEDCQGYQEVYWDGYDA